MPEQVPKVRFRVQEGEEGYFLWVPRRLLILHLNRRAQGEWVPATYAQRRGRRRERMEGFVALRDLSEGAPATGPRRQTAGPPPLT